jgi:hypothetical protein
MICHFPVAENAAKKIPISGKSFGDRGLLENAMGSSRFSQS